MDYIHEHSLGTWNIFLKFSQTDRWKESSLHRIDCMFMKQIKKQEVLNLINKDETKLRCKMQSHKLVQEKQKIKWKLCWCPSGGGAGKQSHYQYPTASPGGKNAPGMCCVVSPSPATTPPLQGSKEETPGSSVLNGNRKKGTGRRWRMRGRRRRG